MNYFKSKLFTLGVNDTAESKNSSFQFEYLLKIGAMFEHTSVMSMRGPDGLALGKNWGVKSLDTVPKDNHFLIIPGNRNPRHVSIKCLEIFTISFSFANRRTHLGA